MNNGIAGAHPGRIAEDGLRIGEHAEFKRGKDRGERQDQSQRRLNQNGAKAIVTKILDAP